MISPFYVSFYFSQYALVYYLLDRIVYCQIQSELKVSNFDFWAWS